MEECYSRRDNAIVYLDIQIGRNMIGRLLIELRADVAPTAAENFRMICAGTILDILSIKNIRECSLTQRVLGETIDPSSGKVRTYKGCVFHRAVQDENCQSGDYDTGDGRGGSCAFNNQLTFDDENFILKHAGPGVLSMVNHGPDTNKSSFFLSFAETQWLDGKNVVFGAVLDTEGLEIVGKMHDVATALGEPLERIVIRDCGQLCL